MVGGWYNALLALLGMGGGDGGVPPPTLKQVLFFHLLLNPGVAVQKNVSGQKLTVFAFTAATGLPRAGDGANLTAYRAIDGGSVTVLADTTASEKDAVNAPGFYEFDLAQAETNGSQILFSCVSSTSGVVVIAVPALAVTVPPAFNTSVAQTGDSFALIGAAGAGLTALAPAATALSTAIWTGSLAAALTTLASHDPGATIASQTNITAASGVALTSAYEFAKGTVAVTESYAANTAAPTPVQALLAIHQMLQDFAITGTSYSVKKLDHTTTAFVCTLDDGSSPTSLLRV